MQDLVEEQKKKNLGFCFGGEVVEGVGGGGGGGEGGAYRSQKPLFCCQHKHTKIGK